MRHRPELDGVRGLAILLVLGQHAGQRIPGGYLGVVVFFVLSGYLITSLLLAEHDRTGTMRLGRFYWRRATRLMPALLLMLAAVPAVGAGVPAHLVAVNMIVAVLYLTNVLMAVAWVRPFGITGFTWSLAMEEQFYLLWPMLLRRALARTSRQRIALWLTVAAGVVTVSRPFLSDTAAYYAPWARADALLVGCALALVGWTFPRWVGWAGVGVVGVLAMTANEYRHPRLGLWVALPLVGLGTAALIGSAEAHRWLRWRPLTHLGAISYALYLWGCLLSALWRLRIGGLPRSWVQVAIWLAASLVLAEASTWLVERPVRRWASRADHHDAVIVARPGYGVADDYAHGARREARLLGGT